MKNKIHTLRVFVIALVLVLLSALVLAGDFNIYNTSDESQTYLAVNGTTGNTGLGMSNSTTLLQLLNNRWISAFNNLTTGVVNMFKINENNAIEVGATLNIGSFEFNEDSGLVTFVDMPVSSTPAAGTAEGYVFKVDGDNIMTIYSEADGSGGIQNKRVGIGSTSPVSQLEVQGSNAAGNITISNSDTTITAGETIGKINFYTYDTDSPLSEVARIQAVAEKDYEGIWSSTGLAFYVASDGNTFIERMRINELGNVGIAQTNPQQELHIQGSLIVESSEASAIGARYGLNLEFGEWDVGYSSFSEYMRIASGGNVGIGDPNPDAYLEVTGPDNSLFMVSSYADGDGDRFIILQDGKVGIGETNPTYNLEVDGTVQFRGGGAGYFGLIVDSSGHVGIGDSTPNANLEVIGGIGDNPFMISNGASGDGDWFMVDSTGNVGIGDPSPDAPLEVISSLSTSQGFMVSSSADNDGDEFIIKHGGKVGILDSDPDAYLEIIAGPACNPFMISSAASADGDHFIVQAGGNVGIGDTDPSEATLSVQGGTICDHDGALGTCASDRRLKENIKPIENAVDYLSKFNPVEFNFIGANEKLTGLIAQDIQEVYPELIFNTGDEDYITYTDPGFKYILVKATQEQQIQIEELKQENEMLKAQMKELCQTNPTYSWC